MWYYLLTFSNTLYFLNVFFVFVERLHSCFSSASKIPTKSLSHIIYFQSNNRAWHVVPQILYEVGSFICTFILLSKLVNFLIWGFFFYDVIKGPGKSKKVHWLKYIEINRVWAQIEDNEKSKRSLSFFRWLRHRWRHN